MDHKDRDIRIKLAKKDEFQFRKKRYMAEYLPVVVGLVLFSLLSFGFSVLFTDLAGFSEVPSLMLSMLCTSLISFPVYSTIKAYSCSYARGEIVTQQMSRDVSGLDSMKIEGGYCWRNHVEEQEIRSRGKGIYD